MLGSRSGLRPLPLLTGLEDLGCSSPALPPELKQESGTLQTLRLVFLRSRMCVSSVLPQSASLSLTPPPPFSQTVPNYRLEIQDGLGMEVEVIKPESLGFSPPPQHILHLHPSTIPILTPTLWPSWGWMALIPCGSPLCQGNSPVPKSGCSH